jgi:hypothetical protein
MEASEPPAILIVLPTVHEGGSLVLWVHRILWIADVPDGATRIGYVANNDERSLFYTPLPAAEVATAIRLLVKNG